MSSSMKSSYSLQKKSQDKTQRIDQNVLGQNSVLRATGSVSLFLKISFLAFLVLRITPPLEQRFPNDF